MGSPSTRGGAPLIRVLCELVGFVTIAMYRDQQGTVRVNFQEAPLAIKACPVESLSDGRSTQRPLIRKILE
jgi:hypothetical protein